MPRRRVTNALRSAARRNIKKAQVSRIRTREPRSMGRQLLKMGRSRTQRTLRRR